MTAEVTEIGVERFGAGDGKKDRTERDKSDGADRAEEKQNGRAAPERALRQRHQGERPTLPVVVGAQQDQHIFERDDDDQRPKDQREDAEHGRGRHFTARGRGNDRFAEGIEWAGTDVAVDDADAADCKRPKAGGVTNVVARAGAQVAPLGSGKTKHHGGSIRPWPAPNAALQYAQGWGFYTRPTPESSGRVNRWNWIRHAHIAGPWYRLSM